MTAQHNNQPLGLPSQSPLFHATQSARYDRQALISQYEEAHNCRLVVLIDAIFPSSVTLVEDLIYDADPGTDLHLMLHSPGGDGETAVRITRSAQAKCKELTVIVPDRAKSAATLVAVGAHHIIMGPASDLGPIDPQFFLEGNLVAAKDIIAAYDKATQAVQDAPDTAMLHISLLSDINALIIQQARAALEGTDELLSQALRSNPDRSPEQVGKLVESLKGSLITHPRTHSGLFDLNDAQTAGLPVIEADLQSEQWQMLWRLWAKYYAIIALDETIAFYEGRRASQVTSLKQ